MLDDMIYGYDCCYYNIIDHIENRGRDPPPPLIFYIAFSNLFIYDIIDVAVVRNRCFLDLILRKIVKIVYSEFREHLAAEGFESLELRLEKLFVPCSEAYES